MMDAELLIKLLDSAKVAYPKIKEVWAKLSVSNKQGYTPDLVDAKELYKISKTALFQSFKGCIAVPLYLNLVRDGLRISYLNDDGRKEEIDKIRGEVYDKYGLFGIRVLSIASTGELENIVKYLVDLKMRKNYNILDLTEEFEGIVKNWDKIASFIKTEHSKEHIQQEINTHIKLKQELFFIFAYGRAVQTTIETIAELNNLKMFSGKYIFTGGTHKNKANIEYYSCVFESSILN